MDKMMYQDLLRFFEIYPEVVYIYENTMSAESYKYFVDNMQQVLTLKKFPMQDVCRVFNVLSRTCQYWDASMFIGQSKATPAGQKLIGTGDHDYHQKFLREVVGRIRHQIYEIPKDQFALTISNLIEFQ